ncbi:MAG: hypothetical protein CITR_00687 [Citrobacter freundii]
MADMRQDHPWAADDVVQCDNGVYITMIARWLGARGMAAVNDNHLRLVIVEKLQRLVGKYGGIGESRHAAMCGLQQITKRQL